MSKTFTIQMATAVEINNNDDFDVAALYFGVQVGTRGRRPKRALVEAILAHPDHTLVDTEYLNAAMAAPKEREQSIYGRELAKLKAVRDKAIQSAKDAFERDRDALRERLQGTAQYTYRVTAKTPQIRDGEVRKSTKDKVLFIPGQKSVDLTMDQIREHGQTGSRGVPSESQVLRAAVIVGEWFPLAHLSDADWATELVRNATVERVPVSVGAEDNAQDAA